MKITSIAKGKVVKEEEREFRFSHHTLNQIEEHICNSEDSSYSTAQLIHDVVSYDPSTANNAQLADDMRICFAWYSTIKEGFSDVKERVKKFKFSEKDVVHLAKAIYSEIEKRKREGNMKHEWNIENMKKHSKDLFDIISKGQSLQTSLVTKEKEEANSKVSTELLDAKDQGCGKAWEVLFAEGMAVQYFEDENDARAFKDEVNECSTNRGFSKDVIHVKYSWVHRHSKTKRCYPVNKKVIHYKCSEADDFSRRKKSGIIKELSRHRRDRCMICANPPVFDVLWAEGKGHAWFCEKHLKKFVKDSLVPCLKAGEDIMNCASDIVGVKEINDGEASKRYADNKNPDVHTKFIEEARIEISKLLSDENLPDGTGIKELELDPEIKNWFRNNLPIYPGGTSDKYDSIELDEFLDKWDSFSIRKPFISLVGSLANWKRTDGDIDILVKAHDPSPTLEALDRAILKCFQIGEEQMADVLIKVNQFIHTDSLFLAAQWRIERAFPEWSGRLHILDDSFSGPFTNFVELADLVAVSCEEKERKEMAQLKKLKLFEWFPMLKPIHGRKKEEIYSVDSVIETIKSRKEDWFETGIYVEKKFDGVHAQAHVAKDYESGKIARIFTEEGTDITKNCPTLRDELRKISGEFILCGELELWKDGKHQPRADCAGVLNSKEVHPDEKYLRFNIFDKLWHKGKDIHDLPFSERIVRLDSIADTDHVKKAKRILCHSEAEVRKAIENVSKEEGSEGAYLKKADFIYELDGKTLNNIKFKNELSCEVQIVKVNIVKERK
jgi:hypothetical protein